MLQPKRVKYRRPHGLSYEGLSKAGNEVSFGESKRSQDGGGSYQAPYSGGGSNSASVPTPAAPPMPADLTEDDFSPLLDTDDDLPF